ncbi:MAG: 3-phosphoserine/phosphohydroxythreonine transaminase [Firmicutes bacterium]|nr:3-phosphoserine/phosphohydroxythreonine transaminase [Bacillota bacterium]
MNRVYNFSAGPSMLPLEVLEQAQKEFVCYGNTGMSVMEMSHRSRDFEKIIFGAEETLRRLMKIPENYSVLFLQGGGSTQFAMVPLNLMNKKRRADYVKTGQWAKKAIAEAQRYGQVNVVASSEDETFCYIPDLTPDLFHKDADYVYLTLNNTIYGTHIPDGTLPDTGDVPIVGDMSSNILAEAYDITKFGLIFAGAQKNLGPAGVTVVIVRNDLLGNAMDITPTMLRYDIHAKERSLYNTPPTYGIYFAGLVFRWVENMGGVAAMEQRNREKAKILYDFLDQSALFRGTVRKKDRSLMNVPFVLPTEELNQEFIRQATDAGFVNLKGHRTVGGMRASIYNAMPAEGVQALTDFMDRFEKAHKIV